MRAPHSNDMNLDHTFVGQAKGCQVNQSGTYPYAERSSTVDYRLVDGEPVSDHLGVATVVVV